MSEEDLRSLRPGQDVSVYVIETDSDGAITGFPRACSTASDWDKAQELMEVRRPWISRSSTRTRAV